MVYEGNKVTIVPTIVIIIIMSSSTKRTGTHTLTGS